MRKNLGLTASFIVLAVAAFGVSGCKPGMDQADAENAPPPLAALPVTAADGGPMTPAPELDQLPEAPPIRVAQIAPGPDRYAYMDRAYYLNEAFGDAPPDYSFDDDQVSPWAWRSDDGYIRVVEPLRNGDRYYYYEPGSDVPFLIRDPDYAYGYADGVLVEMYDSRGRTLPGYEFQGLADDAARYLARGALLFTLSQRDHQPVARGDWDRGRSRIVDDEQSWSALPPTEPDWRAYHDAHANQEQAHWAQEMYRRDAEGARFAQQVNDQQQAQRDLQAAHQAAQIAQANHIPVPAGRPAGSPDQHAFSGPPPAPPNPGPPDHQAGQAQVQAAQAQAMRQAQQQALAQNHAGAEAAQRANEQQAAQAEAAHQAHQQALGQQQDHAAQQAQIQHRASAQAAQHASDQQRVQTQSARQAHEQALGQQQGHAAQAAQQAQIQHQAAAQTAQHAGEQQAAQAARQARQQALAQHQVQAAQHANEQQATQAAHQAQQQAAAQHQAQAAQHASEQQAVQAAHQAQQQASAQHQAQAAQQASVQAARQAQVQAVAARQAQARAAHAAPPKAPDQNPDHKPDQHQG